MNQRLLVLVCIGLFAHSAYSQQQPPTPQLLSVFPAGGKAGTEVNVKIVEQSELEFADELLFSHSGISCKPKLRETNRFYPDPVPVRNEFVVSIGKDVAPGVYEVRARCEYGISNPRRFVVSRTNEFAEQEPNDRFENATEMEANSVGNGTFEAGYDYYKVKVKKGQSLTFRCVAEQIDSRGDPVLAIFDENQRAIAKNHDTLGKDALVSYRAEKDEIVYVRVNDLTFVSQGGAGTTSYRLVVSEAPWIDFVDPPIIQKGVDAKVKIYGRNLGSVASGVVKSGVELEVIDVTINSNTLSTDGQKMFSDAVLVPSRYSSSRVPYRYETRHGKSNPVFLDVASSPTVPEKMARQSLKSGSEVLGVFAETGEVDQFRFQAKKGDRFWIEVVSQRMGIPTDPLLIIESIQKDKEGKETFRSLVTVDDFQPMTSPFRFRLGTEDPGTLFEVPADGEYRISVNDQFNLPPNCNGPNYYKLVFKKPEPRVDLVAVAGLERGQNDNNSRALKIYPCIVRPNAGAEIQVFAYRSPGFDKAIELSVEGLPQGVTAATTIINGSSHYGTIVLKGSAELKSGVSKVKVIGTYADNGNKVVVPVANAEVTTNSVGNEPSESRLTDEIFVIADSVVKFPGKITLSQNTFETARGGVIEAKAKFEKNPDHTGQILQAFVHGLPRTVSKNSNTIPDNGTEVTYKIDFRQGSPAGTYSAFVRGYFEANTKRFEKKFADITAEQKRITSIQQKVEAEYRKATQDRQRLTSQITSKKQAVSRMASQLRTTATQVASSRKKLDEAQANLTKDEGELKKLLAAITSLNQMAGLEMDVAKKKGITEQVNAKNQEKVSLEKKVATVKTALDSARKQFDTIQKSHQTLMTQEAGLKTEVKNLEGQQKQISDKEAELSKEITLGQTVKREIDADLNLARQASQQRRRRFQVYSEPIRINVAEYPVELALAKTEFVLEQGKSEKISVGLKRLFEFKGDVSLQLRPGSGASGWSLKGSPRFRGDQAKLELELTASNSAKVGKFDGQIVATMRNGSTNLTKSIPVKVEIKAKN